MFVVQVSRDGMPFDMKVFEELPGAMARAREHVEAGDDAKVYRVADAKNARAAVLAVEMGCGELVAAPTRALTETESARLDREYWKSLLDDL